MGFMIYDKKDGAFSLEVDWVKAVAQKPASSQTKGNTIVGKALADGRFGTLAAALTESGLLEVLQGDGPLTVFAPTDEAFAKLPKGTVESLFEAGEPGETAGDPEVSCQPRSDGIGIGIEGWLCQDGSGRVGIHCIHRWSGKGGRGGGLGC